VINIGRRKKYNNVELNLQDENGMYGIGYCSNTNNKFYFDMNDYEIIRKYTWCEHINKNGYHSLESYDGKTNKVIRMHYLFGCKGYDHADKNPLNNRRYNLRAATTFENAQNHNKQKSNTSGIIGVEWNKANNKWRSSITVNTNKIFLGYFARKNDAIYIRLKAEKKYFGEFAPQKHLFEKYGINTNDEYLCIDTDRKTRRDNTSGVTGVTYNKKRNKWVAQIVINGKPIYLGRFNNIQDAIFARLFKEKEYFGNNAPQFYLFEQYNI